MKKKEQFYRDPIEVRDRIKALKLCKLSFKVVQTNYTTTIIFPNEEKEMYLTTIRSIGVFKANKIIQKEAVPNYIEADFEGRCEYYDLNSEKFLDLAHNPEQVYNIDLKAAYPTALKRYGLISEKTYKMLLRMDKLDRLASIGMFASRKVVFHINQGELMNLTEEQGKYKNIFFLAAYATDEVMKNCREIIGGNDFVFYWFDGIYFTGREKIKAVSEYLKGSTDIDFRQVWLQDFKANDVGEYIKISFKERSKGEKSFSLPKRQTISNHRSIIESVLE